LADYFPLSGFSGKETTYESSPNDLIELTNANEVFAVDYYLQDQRVAAGLVTKTKGKVYNHSKQICDRLNGKALVDLRKSSVNGHEIVYAVLQSDEGIEHAVWFSVKKNQEAAQLYSFWNIDQYPEGDYLNFQLWGNSPAEVFHLVDVIINKLNSQFALTDNPTPTPLPKLVLRKGQYEQGKLRLDLLNRDKAKKGTLIASIRDHESGTNYTKVFALNLKGATVENVVVETGALFDAGFQLKSTDEPATDAFYLADGAWGVDYDSKKGSIFSWEIFSEDRQPTENGWLVERPVALSAESNGVINIFRNLKSGHNSLDLTIYKGLELSYYSNVPIQLSIVPKELKDWNDRMTYTLPENKTGETIFVSFEELDGFHEGNEKRLEVRTIVFSYLNKSGNTETIDLAIDRVFFTSDHDKWITSSPIEELNRSTYLYPNPFEDKLSISTRGQDIDQVTIYNAQQKVVFKTKLWQDGERMQVDLPRGWYIVEFQSGDRKTHQPIIKK
jgi:hypothetical protein